MKPFPSFLLVLAGLATAAGCSAPVSRAEIPPRSPGWTDSGTPAPSIAMEREVRYYRDETGAVWDDRGKKHESMP